MAVIGVSGRVLAGHAMAAARWVALQSRSNRIGRTGRIFVTETTESLEAPTAPDGADAPRAGRGRARKGEGLSGMVLTDLKALASQLGIRGTSGMRKGDLVAAITAKQGEGAGSKGSAAAKDRPATNGHSREPELPLGELATAPPADAAAGGQRSAAASSQAPAAENAGGNAESSTSSGRTDGSTESSTDGAADRDGDSDQESGSAAGEDGQRGRRNRRGRRDRADGVEASTNGAATAPV